ncbi:MAG: BON domain-containing protein [Planctomycetota bacterium]
MRISRLLCLTALFLAAASLNGSAFAQGGGGGTGGGGGGTGGGGGVGGGGGIGGGGGNTGGGGFGGGGTGGGSSNLGTNQSGGSGSFNSGSSNFGGQSTGGTSQGTTGGTTGGGGASNSSQPLNLDNQLNITPNTPTAVDERNQGFIGPNAQQIITQGFVGASTQLSGAQPANGTSFGGGVNTQSGGAGGGIGGAQGLRATGTNGGRNRNAMGGLGGFGNTATAGVRRNVRNRLVNQVQVNRVPAAEVAQRFTTRLDRIPLEANAGNDVKIALEKGTAVLTGSVPSSEAANRIERQLRLEPGVYKIDNRLEVNR